MDFYQGTVGGGVLKLLHSAGSMGTNSSPPPPPSSRFIQWKDARFGLVLISPSSFHLSSRLWQHWTANTNPSFIPCCLKNAAAADFPRGQRSPCEHKTPLYQPAGRNHRRTGLGTTDVSNFTISHAEHQMTQVLPHVELARCEECFED